GVPRRLDDVLHRGADVGDMRAGPGDIDRDIQGTLGDVDQALRLRAHAPYRHRDRRVTVVPLVADPEIEPNDVAVAKRPLARRDTMHDLVVDGEADTGRERLAGDDIPLEGGLRLLLADPLLRDRVEIGRRDPGAYVAAHLGEDLRHDPTRRAHALDLVPRL